MKVAIYTLFISLTLMIACTKPPDYPDEPVLSNIRISKNTMAQESVNPDDFIIITMDFTDGDGDIGSEGSDIDLYIYDSRTDTIDNSVIKLPMVPEQGSGNGISGEISLKLLPTCCIPPENLGIPCSQVIETDTVSYEIYIKDRAGHESNRLITEPIYIQCRQ